MSTVWLESKYVTLASSHVKNFKQKNSYHWNFSCPICGDSQTNKRKARGYVYPSNKGILLYYCHKEGKTYTIPQFLEKIDNHLYQEFLKEKLAQEFLLKQDHEAFVQKLTTPVFQSESVLKGLKKISQLPYDHLAKRYVDSRRIPTNLHYKLFYVPNFKHWVNSFIPGKFQNESNDEPRLIIPFIGESGRLIGVQGRALKDTDMGKYITIKIDETSPKLYGLDTVDTHKHIYVVEGPIDSMFLPNAIATMDSNLSARLDYFNLDKKQFTLIHDNQPRNPQIVNIYNKSIKGGWRVCIWPPEMEGKDINDLILSGLSSEDVLDIIDSNTFSGLEAQLRFSKWSKVTA